LRHCYLFNHEGLERHEGNKDGFSSARKHRNTGFPPSFIWTFYLVCVIGILDKKTPDPFNSLLTIKFSFDNQTAEKEQPYPYRCKKCGIQPNGKEKIIRYGTDEYIPYFPDDTEGF